MNEPRGSRLPESGRISRPASRPLLVSLAVHVVMALVLAQFFISPTAFSKIFGGTRSKEVPAERIGFLRLPRADGPAVAGRSGGDNRPASDVPARQLLAPSETPSALPDAPVSTRAEVEEGSGPLMGSGGPARGIRPTYTGPKVWAAPGDIVAAPRSAKERLDSAIVSILKPFNDSIAVAAGERKPGDWTFERGGRKYGIDPQYIRLGKLSIPTAVLALLPINQTANPTMNDRNRLQNQLHADIFWQAQRGMNDADFKKAVRSIRQRKEREKADADKKARQAVEPAAHSSPERQ